MPVIALSKWKQWVEIRDKKGFSESRLEGFKSWKQIWKENKEKEQQENEEQDDKIGEDN